MEQHELIFRHGTLKPEQLQVIINDMWNRLRINNDIKQHLKDYGIDADVIDLNKDCPITIKPYRSGLISTDILVCFATSVAGAAAYDVLKLLFTKYMLTNVLKYCGEDAIHEEITDEICVKTKTRHISKIHTKKTLQ